jgi:hypothetical protein
MRLIHTEQLFDVGRFSDTDAWTTIDEQIRSAIEAVHWPPGSDSFTLNGQRGKKRGEGNGVVPIKIAWQQYLKAAGWRMEQRLPIIGSLNPGPVDAVYPIGENRFFCAEWETGNISSSHRALNKMLLGIMRKILVGGALIVPSREMYMYLTDRVGNYQELQPYLPVWRAFAHTIDEGLLIIYVVEHDQIDPGVPRIAKGTDGRALL